ncbi:MAG: tetratricopeptide repeat protein [Marinicellaceae bacterium]
MKNLALIVFLFLISCSSAPKYKYEANIKESDLNNFMQNKPEAYREFFKIYLRQGQRNAVLNEMRIGLMAFHNQDYDLSAWLFDRAINKIETIYANNKKAKKARSKFTREEVKDFKGDPYERAMVYFYRGLIYLHNDDYENARASMLGGLLQDSLAEDHTYEQDFASHYYIAAWASACNGNPSQAEDYYKQALKYKPHLTIPNQNDSVLMIATSGISPIKKRQGKYNEQRYFETSADIASYQIATPDLKLNNKSVPFYMSDNLHWQATTRGGRAIDIINEGKAEFKENTDKAGDSFVKTGSTLMNQAAYSNNQDLGNAGAVFALVGLISKGFSRASKPTADIRYWDNLPSQINIATMNKDTLNSAQIHYNFIDNASQLSHDYSRKFQNKLTSHIQSNASCDLLVLSNKSHYLTYRHINP